MRRPLRPSRLASKSLERSAAAVSSELARCVGRMLRSVRLSFQQQRILCAEQARSDRVQLPRLEVARLSGPLDLGRLGGEHRDDLRAPRGAEIDFPRTPRRTDANGGNSAAAARTPSTCDRARRARSSGDSTRGVRNCCANRSTSKRSRLLRCQLLRLDEDDHALVIKLHHLVTDGWSQRLFWEELAALYAGELERSGRRDCLSFPSSTGISPSGSEPGWQRRPPRSSGATGVRSSKGSTELPLRTDRPRTGMRTGRGARHPLQALADLDPRHQVV